MIAFIAKAGTVRAVSKKVVCFLVLLETEVNHSSIVVIEEHLLGGESCLLGINVVDGLRKDWKSSF
jgi:hypothetical protein